jgi:1,2-diacylglycerol 3-beta-galactosyltransferase
MQQQTQRHTKRLVLLFSDTGGGHRSSACAVAQALRDLYGEQVQVELVDPLADYAPWPYNRLDDLYPYMVRLRGWGWAAGYHLSDGPRRAALLMRRVPPPVQTGLLRLVQDHPADAIVSCHPLFSKPILRVLIDAGIKTPLITLVTDLGTAHALWFEPGVTYCLVPTEGARQAALACGLPADRIQVTGLPVSSRFAEAAQEDPLAMRRRLGLAPDLPVVLLVSGAEGMGPVRRLCKRIVDSGVRAQLAIIAGRNERLRASLAAKTWPLPVRVEGFVDNMHEWMRAADLLVTKAGPSTVSEALVVGLPMVLSGALPGQEQPNVDHIVQAGAGIWAPAPKLVAEAICELLTSAPSKLDQMSARALVIARPDAAQQAAEAIWAIARQAEATRQPVLDPVLHQ